MAYHMTMNAPFANILRTDRMRLRPPGDADRPFLEALWRDADVRRFLGGPSEADPLAPGPARRWLAEAEAPLGLLSLGPHEGGETELSYQFAGAHWGQGLAFEAARAICDHVADLGLPALVAETQAANAASRRLLARLGFAEVQRLIRFGAPQILYRQVSARIP